MAQHRDNRDSFCTSYGTQSERGRKPCRGVSHNRLRDQEAHGRCKGVNRRAGSGRKTVVNRDSLRDAIRSRLRTSVLQHARRLGVAVRTKCLKRCRYDPKFASAGRIIIISDKTWTVDPVRNRRNGRYWSLGERGRECPYRVKNETSSISYVVRFVASNGTVMPLIYFPFGYRLTAREYKAKLANKLVPSTNNTFDMSSVTVVLQQDGTPAHRSHRV